MTQEHMFLSPRKAPTVEPVPLDPPSPRCYFQTLFPWYTIVTLVCVDLIQMDSHLRRSIFWISNRVVAKRLSEFFKTPRMVL